MVSKPHIRIRTGRDIAAERRRYRVTQRELALALGVHAVVLSYIEVGIANPTPEMCQQICSFLERKECEGA